MKKLLIPVAALAVASFSLPAVAGERCSGSKHKDQTAEQPTEPVQSPST